ncbi:hypothetical protein AAZX31_13G046500 [Glycine max]|uniref:DUF1997 family protein n=1 Tax=Glycine soja TaxID=3848 RepID=A0A445HBX1_GLYSO|nr:uncharacterized protein LOC114381946 [Glycine soja]XP_040864627.1 uncharacterized protein LOC106794137 [Glycine max]KAG4383326.1 hypothetical protein GLYMA_13G060852v4 [Glycine max]KAG4969730.1 hypothetical protein JHK85_036151 [Glycine max]KAG4976088.1 hypothetical protein JHK86_035562 [Glycine max]KAG5112164.1 hypothetical protein JHK82_035433 [Glycine max]KAG5129444.1 hypothetical protein JHK84_035841 [Glycine max]
MASLLMIPCQHLLLKKLQRHCHRKAASNSIRSEKTSSFSFRSNANVPFHELPGASFDQYMDDKHRVLRAVFSDDKGTTKQLNEEEWRIKMPPIQCLFLSVNPTADVRLTFRSNGEDYPPEIPHHVPKVLELHFIRWELQGLNSFYKDPYQISIDVRGSLYPERKGKHSWLKNQMVMTITFCASPAIAFIPENVLQDAIELIFKTVWDEMKHEFHGRLLEDYNRFKRNKSKKNSV